MTKPGNLRHTRGKALACTGFVALALALGCSDSASSGGGGVATSYDALTARFAQCAKDANACLTQAGADATAQAACEAQLQTCHDDAKAELDAFKTAVSGCVDDAKACASQADASVDDLRVCRDQLRDCVKSNLPAPPPCFAALQTCVQSGGDPHDCASQARACIAASFPQLGGLLGHHGGDDEDGGADDDGHHHGSFGGFGFGYAADGGCRDGGFGWRR